MTDANEQTASNDGFEWAIVEIFGHRRHVGRAREEERFGAKMLRIDVPTVTIDAKASGPEKSVEWVSHFYGGSSIFSFTPTDEATVMRYAQQLFTPALPYRAEPDEDAEDFEDSERDYDHG